MMNIYKGTGMVLITAVILFSSCNMNSDTEISDYEEEFLMEQTASSMSADEGGAVYIVEELSDPAYYQELEENTNLEYDSSTGKFSINLLIDLPNSAGEASAELQYSLYDESGNLQSGFDSTTTRRVAAVMELNSDIETLRYTGSTTMSATVTVEGINTSSVTANGNWSGERTSRTTENAQRSFSSNFSYEAELNDLSLSYDTESGAYILVGGSTEVVLSGSINEKIFSRTAEWVFGSGHTATMIYQGEQVTVDLETGTIED